MNMYRFLFLSVSIVTLSIPETSVGDSMSFSPPGMTPQTMSRAISADTADNDIQSFDDDTRTLSLRNGNTVPVDPEGSGSSGYGGLPGSDPDEDGTMEDLDPDAPTDSGSGWRGAMTRSEWVLIGQDGECTIYDSPTNTGSGGEYYYEDYKWYAPCRYQATQLYIGSDQKLYGQRTYAMNALTSLRLKVRIRPYNRKPDRYYKSKQEFKDLGHCVCPETLAYDALHRKNKDPNDILTGNVAPSWNYWTMPNLFSMAGWEFPIWCDDPNFPDDFQSTVRDSNNCR